MRAAGVGILALLALLARVPCFADAGAPSGTGGNSPSASGKSNWLFYWEGSYTLLSGAAGASLAGQTLYSGAVALEQASGFLRIRAGVGFDYMPAALLTLGAESSTVKFSGFKVLAGFSAHPLAGSGLQPFLAAGGTFTRGSVDSAPGTSSVPAYSRPNLYGYYVALGVDFKRKKTARTFLRVRVAYTTELGNFGNVDGYKTNGMSFGAGVGF